MLAAVQFGPAGLTLVEPGLAVVEAAIQPIVERISARLVFAIARAAHGWTDTWIVSRQTSYRPIERS